MSEAKSFGERLSELSWRELLTIGVFLVTAALQTGTVLAKLDATEARLQEVIQAMDAVRDRTEALREDVALLKLRVSSLEEDLNDLKHAHRSGG